MHALLGSLVDRYRLINESMQVRIPECNERNAIIKELNEKFGRAHDMLSSYSVNFDFLIAHPFFLYLDTIFKKEQIPKDLSVESGMCLIICAQGFFENAFDFVNSSCASLVQIVDNFVNELKGRLIKITLGLCIQCTALQLQLVECKKAIVARLLEDKASVSECEKKLLGRVDVAYSDDHALREEMSSAVKKHRQLALDTITEFYYQQRHSIDSQIASLQTAITAAQLMLNSFEKNILLQKNTISEKCFKTKAFVQDVVIDRLNEFSKYVEMIIPTK